MGQRVGAYWIADVVSATVNADGSATVYFLVKQGLNNVSWSLTAAQCQAIVAGTVQLVGESYVSTGMRTSIDVNRQQPEGGM